MAIVARLQEQAYGRLAEGLGFGWDPIRAHRHLAGSGLDPERMASGRAERRWGALVDVEDWGLIDSVAERFLARYGNLQAPTPWEDPNLFPMMTWMADTLEQTYARVGIDLEGGALVGTLPSGNVNAVALEVPETGERVVLFEQGLFHFVQQVAVAIGLAMPTVQIDSGTRTPRFGDVATGGADPEAATRQMMRSTVAYLTEGNPRLAKPVEPSGGAFLTAMHLVRVSEMFVLAHELMHVHRGHLAYWDEPDEVGRAMEFEADEVGATVAIAAHIADGGSPAIGLWGCDMALMCLCLIEAARGVLKEGEGWTPSTGSSHPSAFVRRSRLREVTLAELRRYRTPPEAVAAEKILRFTDAAIGPVWDAVMAHVARLAREGVRRSPPWA